jgi:hypothetical protein
MLSARVLHVANSAAYASARPVVHTIPDAVRQVGMSTVRNVASSLGIFEAMPPSSADGFNPIRCWQHSLAVAMLCERLVPKRLFHNLENRAAPPPDRETQDGLKLPLSAQTPDAPVGVGPAHRRRLPDRPRGQTWSDGLVAAWRARKKCGPSAGRGMGCGQSGGFLWIREGCLV